MTGIKGKLLGLVGIFVLLTFAAGTGAFSTITADRTAEINVAGDASGLLSLTPASGSTGAAYANLSDGQLQLNLGGSAGASGVNPNAMTAVSSVFMITNQGSQDITVYLTRSGAHNAAIEFAVPTSSLATASDHDEIHIPGSGAVTTITVDGKSDANSITLDPGQSISVGFYIDTTDADPTDRDRTGGTELRSDQEIISSITITAEADPSRSFNDSFEVAQNGRS